MEVLSAYPTLRPKYLIFFYTSRVLILKRTLKVGLRFEKHVLNTVNSFQKRKRILPP